MKLRNRARLALAGAGVLGLVLSGVVAAPMEASAATAGVKIAEWCGSPQRTGKVGWGGGWNTGYARAKNAKNAYSWVCVAKGPLGVKRDAGGVDMNAACRLQTKKSKAYAKLGNPKDAYSWRCVY